jgi:hypothetical protein
MSENYSSIQYRFCVKSVFMLTSRTELNDECSDFKDCHEIMQGPIFGVFFKFFNVSSNACRGFILCLVVLVLLSGDRV